NSASYQLLTHLGTNQFCRHGDADTRYHARHDDARRLKEQDKGVIGPITCPRSPLYRIRRFFARNQAKGLTKLLARTITNSQHLYEVRPRNDKRGVDLISDALPFGA